MLLQSLTRFATYADIDDILKLIIKIIENDKEIKKKMNIVHRWLALEENRRWLVIFDNIDWDYHAEIKNSQTYDLEFFFSAIDHDFILIITRLFHLEEFETATQVMKVNRNQALQILINNSCLSQSDSNNRILWLQSFSRWTLTHW